MEVRFDDGKFVIYDFEQLEEVVLAYATTIHKAQGSEYPAVVLPLLSGPDLLMNRNILYTAVTRAKKCVCITGSDAAVTRMINNVREQKRYSGLKERILEFKGRVL
ncbi:MAG: ATP-dependent RecD-like DNA helicase [Lachnospiraceae bacterium]|nr:ATP-dependent RecD-like DNA helicase [Lachnospiraceae bacterium]